MVTREIGNPLKMSLYMHRARALTLGNQSEVD